MQSQQAPTQQTPTTHHPSGWHANSFLRCGQSLPTRKTTTAGDAFGLGGYPYFVLIDGSGKVVKRMSGEIPMDELTVLLTALLPA